MPLIYGGQEEPLEKRSEFFEKDDIGFSKYAMFYWCTTILKAKHENEALWNGEFGGKPEFLLVDDQILAYKREKNNDRAICILDLSNKNAAYKVNFDPAGMSDIFTGLPITISDKELTLEPWAYKTLTNE